MARTLSPRARRRLFARLRTLEQARDDLVDLQVAEINAAYTSAVRDVRDDINPELSKLILRCLEKDPDKRIQSARRLQRTLERIESGKTTKRRWFSWGRNTSQD